MSQDYFFQKIYIKFFFHHNCILLLVMETMFATMQAKGLVLLPLEHLVVQPCN